MGIDFSVNMLWVCDCGVCLVFMWVCRLMENTSSSGGFGTSMPDGNAPLWAYVTKIEKSSGGGGNGMLEIASLTLDEPELEEEIMGATSETVGASAPVDSESVVDGDDEEDIVVLG